MSPTLPVVSAWACGALGLSQVMQPPGLWTFVAAHPGVGAQCLAVPYVGSDP